MHLLPFAKLPDLLFAVSISSFRSLRVCFLGEDPHLHAHCEKMMAVERREGPDSKAEAMEAEEAFGGRGYRNAGSPEEVIGNVLSQFPIFLLPVMMDSHG